ncbi:MAG: radical SAM protein [candidate division Zixibacteria bacterium]|nr:radical SAM protein [Candidatus Tariuqbacter arcticus]
MLDNDELNSRANTAWEIYRACEICPRKCGVDRISGETGDCGQTAELKIAAAVPHFGEEPPLVGNKGVGNIFLTGCNLSCVYCQNYQASQENIGEIVSFDWLAGKMLEFQTNGLESVGWVTPSHTTPGLMKSLSIAMKKGFQLPLIYNTNSYDRLDTLRLLDGVVDIYLADMRYSDDENALRYSDADDYVEISRMAVEEMLRQVGPFCLDDNRKTGIIIRLLVLPENIAGLWETLCFIALELSPEIPISLMSQYQPVHRANEFPELNRCITQAEYAEALKMAKDLGFGTIFTQDLNEKRHLLPDFTQADKPFQNGI